MKKYITKVLQTAADFIISELENFDNVHWWFIHTVGMQLLISADFYDIELD